MKQVVIVTGSPRPGGNSTLLAEAFAEGAREEGHIVMIFDSVRRKVEGCVACGQCWSKGKPCVYEDGFNEFGTLLEKADVVVFATPVYWGTYPAQMKALIDKFYAYGIRRTKVDIREKRKMYLLACGDGKKDTAFSAILELAWGFAEFQKWEFAGYITVPELVEAGEIRKTDALEEARHMGRCV
ncbi:flavodoxin family protein [Zhenpiania hominis]|uniref:flavodoxin family protein n=1 Tax=Zhenpiania hominis TaxID=2763644 RepID=UPI0039F53A9B